jgi:hypothetical protein
MMKINISKQLQRLVIQPQRRVEPVPLSIELEDNYSRSQDYELLYGTFMVVKRSHGLGFP